MHRQVLYTEILKNTLIKKFFGTPKKYLFVKQNLMKLKQVYSELYGLKIIGYEFYSLW